MAKKRGRNEGTIFQRKDGRWCATVDLGWEGGRRKRKCFYEATRKKVANVLNKALRDNSEGLRIAVERQTVGQFLTRWLAESVKPSVRPLTYEQYAQHVRLYIEPAIGKVRLSKLAPQQVLSLINGKLKDGLSPRTIQITLFVLRRALAQAVKWDLMARNVAELVDGPRVERKEVRPPTGEQVQAFLSALKGERLEALFIVGFALGLRRGEVLGLRWEDVDFENRAISVKQACSVAAENMRVAKTKEANFVLYLLKAFAASEPLLCRILLSQLYAGKRHATLKSDYWVARNGRILVSCFQPERERRLNQGELTRSSSGFWNMPVCRER